MNKKKLFIIASFLPLLIPCPAPADFDWADSPDFEVDLLSIPPGGGYDYQDSSNFTLDLYPINRGWADSGEFSYENGTTQPGAPGEYTGVLYDLATGEAIAGATVSIPGQASVVTDENGGFSFDEVPSGTVTVTITREGYYAVTRTITIGEGSLGFAPITMIQQADADGPAVVQIEGKYFTSSKHSYYLQGISVIETVKATIDWNAHTPGQVQWILPDGTVYTDTVAGNTASRTLDMGGIGLGKLTVVALDADSVNSPPKQANFSVIDPPPGVPSLVLMADTSDGTLSYSAEWILDAIDEGVEAGIIDGNMPGFGGRAFKFGVKPLLKAKITSDGSATTKILDGYNLPPMHIADVNVVPSVTVELGWTYQSTQEQWLPIGSIGIEVSGGYQSPPSYYIIMVGPIPIPVYWRTALEAALGVNLAITGWYEDGSPEWNGQIPFRVYAEIMLGVGVADILAAEGYLGGAANMLLEFPSDDPLKQLSIELEGGIRLTAWIFKYENDLLHYEWYLVGGDKAALAPTALSALERIDADDFAILDRDYLAQDYAIWAPGIQQTKAITPFEADGKAENEEEQTLQYNVFYRSQPTITADGNDLLLAWIYDDPTRDPCELSPNRTQVVFSECADDAWSDPAAIDDDGTADFSPQLITLPGGNALCLWENLAEVLPLGTSLTDMAGAMEIEAAFYDSSSGTWTAQNLTDNAHLDRTPRIAAADDGTAMAVWISNDNNDVLGSDANALNEIRYSLWDGAAWTEPNTIATDIGLIVKTDLAYKGDQAIYVYTLDIDHDWATETDRELYTVIHDSNGFSPPYRLTEDALLDANPQIAYDQNDLLMVWYRDANLVACYNFDMENADQILATSASSGSMDFRLTRSPAGQISLVWTEASSQGVDIMTATYDADLDIWSNAYQLTADGGMEHSVAATYAGDAELALSYNKVMIVDNNGVPEPNRVDLCVVRHPISTDLSIMVIAINTTVGAATTTYTSINRGAPIELTAEIVNTGDAVVRDIQVAFYNGNPDANGVLIDDIQTAAGPIPAGGSAVVGVTWIVPEVNEPLWIYAVIDPNYMLEDADRSNNITKISPLAAELTVSSITSERIGPKMRGITARVANLGALPAENVDVAIRRDSATGPELTTISIANLDPNSFQDVWHVWDITAEDFNDVEIAVYVTADEPDDVVEWDEENNVSFALVQVGKTADITDNGRIDAIDLFRFTEHWGDACSKPEWCGGCDIDASRRVDFVDFALFCDDWLWQAGWYSE